MEPKQTRIVTVSINHHRATLGMLSMQLLGFHFVRALQSGVGEWTPPAP
ncbi:MAG TPA: hypothetical protein VF478_09825 [Anaerolineae bacterium]